MRQSDYRSYVGDADKYDVRGASQFGLLVSMGMREEHHVMELGCGGLDAGRFYIPYLQAGHYAGIESNKAVVMGGLECELGVDIADVKEPDIRILSEPNLRSFGKTFDYVVASHYFFYASILQMKEVLGQLGQVLSKRGLFVFSYKRGAKSSVIKTWSYPTVNHYTTDFFVELSKEFGYDVYELMHHDPEGHGWMVLGAPKAIKLLVEQNPEILSYGDEDQLRLYGHHGKNRRLLQELGLKDRKVYVVTGMHRSGTSFVARSLHQAGVDMGEGALMGPNEENKLGHVENAAFVQLNSQILKDAGGLDWWWTPDEHLVRKHALERSQEFASLVDEWQRPFWGFKDPRFSLTGRSLLPLLPEEEDVYLICVFRKPHKVAESMVQRRYVGRSEAVKSVLEHDRRILYMIGDFVGLDVRVD